MISFASDNYAPAHPRALEAIAAANEGHAAAYGGDPWTARAAERICELFDDDVEVFFVFNGTGANVASLAALARPFEAVICAAGAHVDVDECGAPERFVGCKLLPVEAPGGKLTPAAVESRLGGRGDEHRAQPRVVTVSQATELGTVYTPAELAELVTLCREEGLRLHVDGARLANAVAATGELPRGADAVSFGGTKNGLVFGEAVVLRRELAAEFPFLRKQATQLPSKGRFVAAQFAALLADGLWLETARHANAQAARLAEAVRDVVEIVQPVESNAVFARVPAEALPALQAASPFYVWDEPRGIVRWMTAWDTTDEDVDAFAAAVRRALGHG
ncbi:MAG TPA: low specificity L-threonine aldolase [Gaiellaceae bacterium]